MRNINNKIRKHSILEIILATIALVGLIKNLYILYDSMYVVNHALPQELREGVTVKLAVEFAKGNNPYGIEYNELNVPVINHYGWFTAAFLSVFIRVGKIFAFARPEVICTIVTLGVVAMGCMALWIAVYIHSNNLYLATIASEVALSCYWRLGFNGGSFPDSYGLTLSLILLWVVERDVKCNKYRYPVYIVLVILMFYTKQYFVLCGAGIFIWLFFQNRKVAIKYTVFGLITGIISIIVVNITLPLYFTEALLYSGITNTFDHNIEYAKTQFQFLFQSYKPMFIVIVSFVITFMLAAFAKGKDRSVAAAQIICVTRYDVIMMLLGTIACFRIGQHGGAIYSYYLQIWIPYVVSVSCVCAFKIMKDSEDKSHYASVLVMLVLLLTPKTCSMFFTPNYVGDDDIQKWKDVYALLDSYSEGDGTKLLLGDPLSFYAVDHDYEAYDYGSTEYAYQGLLDSINPFIRNLFIRADWLIERVEETRIKAKEKIENGEFTCLVILDGNPCRITHEYVDNTGKYELYSETVLQTGGQRWPAFIYVLKGGG